MTKFSDICMGREYTKNGEKKMAWTRVGKLIEKGDKRYVKLEVLPLPGPDGEVFLHVFEERQQQSNQSSPADGEHEEPIPF